MLLYNNIFDKSDRLENFFSLTRDPVPNIKWAPGGKLLPGGPFCITQVAGYSGTAEAP